MRQEKKRRLASQLLAELDSVQSCLGMITINTSVMIGKERLELSWGTDKPQNFEPYIRAALHSYNDDILVQLKDLGLDLT